MDYFAQIERVAREENGWQLIAAIFQHPGGDGYVPHGLAIIKRDHAPSGREGTEYGVTAWTVHPHRASFGESDYDLTAEEALLRLFERAQTRGRIV